MKPGQGRERKQNTCQTKTRSHVICQFRCCLYLTHKVKISMMNSGIICHFPWKLCRKPPKAACAVGRGGSALVPHAWCSHRSQHGNISLPGLRTGKTVSQNSSSHFTGVFWQGSHDEVWWTSQRMRILIFISDTVRWGLFGFALAWLCNWSSTALVAVSQPFLHPGPLVLLDVNTTSI